MLSYEKCERKTLMKLTPYDRVSIIFTIVRHNRRVSNEIRQEAQIGQIRVFFGARLTLAVTKVQNSNENNHEAKYRTTVQK